MISEKLFQQVPKLKEITWKKLGNRPNNSVLSRDLYAKGFRATYIKKMLDIDFDCTNALFVSPALFMDADLFNEFRKKFLAKISNDPYYYKSVVARYSNQAEKFQKLCSELSARCFSNMADKELLHEFNQAIEENICLMPFSYMNFNEEDIPNTLLDDLLMRKGIKKEEFGIYKSQLIIPLEKKTLLEQEKQELVMIAEEVKIAEKVNGCNCNAADFIETITPLIKNHIKKYVWIKSKYFNVYRVSFEETLKRVVSLLRNPNAMIGKDLPEQGKSRQCFEELVEKLKLSETELMVVNLLRELLYLKTLRKELIGMFSYSINGITSELAKRMHLSHEELVSLTLDEINHYFESGAVPDREEIKARIQGFAYIYLDGKTQVIGGIMMQERYEEGLVEVRGETGYKGIVRGIAKVIANDSEINIAEIKAAEGAIIITDSISPNAVQSFLGLNIKGIITNHGGILSHAAIIARERAIPCIIGTGNATAVFKDGDEIELDADRGIAKKVKCVDFDYNQYMHSKKFRKMFGISMGLCRADLYMPTHVFNTADVIGKGHDHIIFKIEGGKNTGYFCEEVIEYMGKEGLNKLYSKEFVERNKKEADEFGLKLWSYAEYINSLPLKHMPDKELVEHYNLLFLMIQKVFGYFNVSQPCISFALEKEIAKKMEEHGIDADVQYEILDKMLKPERTTLIEDEEKDLIKLALKIKSDKALFDLFLQPLDEIIGNLHHLNSHEVFQSLILHETKYSFMASSENFDEFDRKYFIERLKDMIVKEKAELEKEIISKTPDKIELSIERTAVANRYGLSPELMHLIDVTRDYSHQRMLVRIYWTKAINVWGRILREFARKMNLSEVDIQYLLREEINDYFAGRFEIDTEELRNRKEFAIFAIFDRQKPILLTEKEAKEFEETYLKEGLKSKSELKGTIASKGIAKGKVKILAYGKNMIQQISEMEQGDILITGNTRPDMIIAMKKASAIVTDEGGIMSHAALVSRELGVPCIVGTKNATEMFKDGDIVEVDANNGIVRKID